MGKRGITTSVLGPRPLMFDRKYQPKPAYYSTRAAFELSVNGD